MEINIATIVKNATETVHIDISDFNGHDLIDIRVWANYKSAAQPKRPTKKGVSLNIEKLPELIYSLEKAQRRAMEAGLLKDEADAA